MRHTILLSVTGLQSTPSVLRRSACRVEVGRIKQTTEGLEQPMSIRYGSKPYLSKPIDATCLCLAHVTETQTAKEDEI